LRIFGGISQNSAGCPEMEFWRFLWHISQESN
jgi:hypothetical protein